MSMRTLKDLGKIVTGNTPKMSERENFDSADIPFIKPGDISDDSITVINKGQFFISENARDKARILPSDSILVTCIGIIGKVGILTREAAFNQQINGIVPDINSVIPRYLAYAILSQKSYLQEKANAAVVPIINKSQFSELKVEVPNLQKQNEIVRNLDKVDHLISLQKQQLKGLDELVKSRFIEMFGHSDRPKVRLGECCIINPKKSSDIRLVDNDLMVSFVSMSDVSEDGQIVTCNHKQYESVKSGFTYFSENDVLFAKITPCMENGKGGIAKGLLNGIGFGSTEFHVLRPIDQVSNSCWLYELTSFPQFRQAAEINMTGSAGQRRVPASFLANYKVSLPPISLQNQFADFVHQLDKSKLAVQKSLDELEILKKSLMQQYFG